MDIRRASHEEEIADAISIRRDVFIDEQGVPEARELDGKDDEAIHFVAYDEDTPIGVARLRAYRGGETKEDRAKVERVAVRKRRRGEGIGKRLMAAVEDAARSEGYAVAVLHAQVPVVPFYEELGYEAVGEEFEEAGIPHRKMTKQL
jgi:predicted GNAT family N-acyltransferase